MLSPFPYRGISFRDGERAGPGPKKKGPGTCIPRPLGFRTPRFSLCPGRFSWVFLPGRLLFLCPGRFSWFFLPGRLFSLVRADLPGFFCPHRSALPRATPAPPHTALPRATPRSTAHLTSSRSALPRPRTKKGTREGCHCCMAFLPKLKC